MRQCLTHRKAHLVNGGYPAAKQNFADGEAAQRAVCEQGCRGIQPLLMMSEQAADPVREARERFPMARERHADRIAAQLPQPLKKRLQRLWIAAWKQADIGRNLRQHSIAADHLPAVRMIKAHMSRCMSASYNQLPFTAPHPERLYLMQISYNRLWLYLSVKALQMRFNSTRPSLRHSVSDEI
ncbi:hypothetical protein D3C75_600910 [compost metagenome]